MNYKKIRKAHNGKILNDQGQFETSAASQNRIDWFLATTSPIANWYHIFQAQKNNTESPFANFIRRAENDTLTINQSDIPPQYLKNQTLIDQRAIRGLWPHLLSKDAEDQSANNLYLPLIEVGGKFYWGSEKHEIPASDIIRADTASSPITIPGRVTIMAFMPEKANNGPPTALHINIPSTWAAPYGFGNVINCNGFSRNLGHALFLSTNQMVDYNPSDIKVWYHFGLYRLALMAAKVNKNNDIVEDTATDTEAQEILQFNRAIKEKPNPWQKIDQKLDNFIEYRVANLFKHNPELKDKAIAVTDVFFKAFGFYQDAIDMGLGGKMRDLPGEDQMLAYYFCQSLRKLSAGSVSAEALIEVLELNPSEARMFNLYLLARGNAWGLRAYLRRKYYEEKTMSDNSKVSYNSVWQEVKSSLALADGTDMVSLSGHGAVLSFDSSPLRAQQFQDRQMANDLGFVTIDSSYAKGLKPFYMVGGN